MNDIVSKFKKLELVSVGMLVLDLIAAMVLYKYSSLSVHVNCLMFGGLLVVHGLFSFIKYFYKDIQSRIFSYNLITGVIALILGLFLCLYNLKTVTVIGILVGIWLISEALLHIVHCVKMFMKSEDIAPLVLFSSLIIMVMGVLAIINPFHKYIGIIRLLSIFVFAYVVLYGMICLLYRKRAKQVLSIFR